MSNLIKVLVIFGTRPEAIKMAPLVKTFDKAIKVDCKVCVTAQHRGMLDQVLNVFDIYPDYDLNLMKNSQTLNEVVSAILTKMKAILDEYKPDYVFVHGDTATTFASSLAAFYNKVTIAHVEAGLRTGNIYSPWPEESNRKLTAVLSTLNFSPTEISKKNLLNEGYKENSIFMTGNTVIDALFYVKNILETDTKFRSKLEEQFSYLKNKKLILVTGHRRESFGDGFEQICTAIKQFSDKYNDVDILYPVHLNPNVQEPVNRILKDLPRVHLVEPVDYVTFVYLMDRSYFILTDSGGVQEEAPSLGKPVLLMRENTERPEAIEAGTVELVGTNIERIVNSMSSLMDNDKKYKKMSEAYNPYGDGSACIRILDALINHHQEIQNV